MSHDSTQFTAEVTRSFEWLSLRLSAKGTDHGIVDLALKIGRLEWTVTKMGERGEAKKQL
jgi:hypothetical protein